MMKHGTFALLAVFLAACDSTEPAATDDGGTDTDDVVDAGDDGLEETDPGTDGLEVEPEDTGDAGPDTTGDVGEPDLLTIEYQSAGTTSIPAGISEPLRATRWTTGGPVDVTGEPGLSWRAESPAILEVSTTGLATGVAAGSAVVRAVLREGSVVVAEGREVLQVDGRVPLELEMYTPLMPSWTMPRDWTPRLWCMVEYGDPGGGGSRYTFRAADEHLEWWTADSAIAEFAADGTLTAHAVGEVRVRATFSPPGGGTPVVSTEVPMTILAPGTWLDVLIEARDWVPGGETGGRCSHATAYVRFLSGAEGYGMRFSEGFSNTDGLLFQNDIARWCGVTVSGLEQAELRFEQEIGGETYRASYTIWVYEPGWAQTIRVTPASLTLAADECADVFAFVSGRDGPEVEITDVADWRMTCTTGSMPGTTSVDAHPICSDRRTVDNCAFLCDPDGYAMPGETIRGDLVPWFIDAPTDVGVALVLTAPGW